MRNIILIFLIALILGIMMPLSNTYLSSQQAFTADNLIRVNLVNK